MAGKALAARPRTVLVLIVALFVIRAVLAIEIVPPWQHPDEPQHFEFVQILATQERLDLSVRSDIALQRRVLASMSEHGWWRHYAEERPTPMPAGFEALSDPLWGVTTSPPAYYLLAATTLGVARTDHLLTRFYTLRWLSVVLGVAAILCIWAGARLLFDVSAAAGMTLLTAVHPQFLLMSTAVNPDALVNLCGAVVWWQGARLLAGRPVSPSVAVLAGATVLGVLTKRIAAPLVLMAVVVPVLPALCGRPGGWRVARRAAGLVAAVVAVVGLVAVVWFGEEVARLREYWSYLVTFSPSPRAGEWSFFLEFTAALFDSAWLVAGWLRYPAPAGWLLTVRLLTAAALTGCIIALWRSSTVDRRAGLVLAGVLVAIQTAGVYVGLYLNGFGPQGRYLFPVLGPFMALFWVGIVSWWPRPWRPLAGASLVAVMFVLDAIGWATVLLPAYLG